MKKTALFWFRRDLRLTDNTALFHALNSGETVLPVFIFDTEILNTLESTKDGRIEFIHNRLQILKEQLETYSSSLLILHGNPIEQFKLLLEKYHITNLYFNRDYEPYAQKRDQEVTELFKKQGLTVLTFKDQVIFEKNDVLKKDGKPYTVFTPYKRKWKEKFSTQPIKSYQTEPLFRNFLQVKPFSMPTLQDIGFKKTDYEFPPATINEKTIKNYEHNRDFPALEGTTRLGIHFRFGTISIRDAVKKANELNRAWLDELIWREFYMMILWHFPKVVDHSFKQKYDMINWRNDEEEFKLWCQGQTGYPMVDAGIRELNRTGYMHNRVRMITASFLTKHLLIDWRWGETYFAQKLLDYELASNNGGWQWAAGSGCDAAPYFRIFNPELQTKRFDPDHTYICKWVPEYKSNKYPRPIVEHKFARERALEEYKRTLKNE
ncbi:MAG: cryptochrome/photolyase family protein [Bacteroidota bacterium]